MWFKGRSRKPFTGGSGGDHGSRLRAVQGAITEAVYRQFKGRSRKPFTGDSRGDRGSPLQAVQVAIAEAVYRWFKWAVTEAVYMRFRG